MDADLQIAYEEIMGAVCAEDLFGTINPEIEINEQLKLLETKIEELMKFVSPDLYKGNPEDCELAEEAKDRLNQFAKKAVERINACVYGIGGARSPEFLRATPAIVTDTRKYFLGSQIAEGDISDIYKGECEIGDEFAGRVIIKVVRDKTDNELAFNETRILKRLHEESAPQWKHLPRLLDSFTTEDGRRGIIMREFEGYDLYAVKEHSRWKKGIPKKHMVWMLNRALSAIGFVHSRGIVHCNIEPAHLMIRPRDHNLCILDWSYAVVDPMHTGERFKIFTQDFSPPEVKEKETPWPSTDIYSIGKIMIWLLGGNIETNEMPDDVDEELQNFLKSFVINSPLQRPQDAWQLHGELHNIVVKLWGRKRFLVFDMS